MLLISEFVNFNYGGLLVHLKFPDGRLVLLHLLLQHGQLLLLLLGVADFEGVPQLHHPLLHLADHFLSDEGANVEVDSSVKPLMDADQVAHILFLCWLHKEDWAAALPTHRVNIVAASLLLKNKRVGMDHLHQVRSTVSTHRDIFFFPEIRFQHREASFFDFDWLLKSKQSIIVLDALEIELVCLLTLVVKFEHLAVYLLKFLWKPGFCDPHPDS